MHEHGPEQKALHHFLCNAQGIFYSSCMAAPYLVLVLYFSILYFLLHITSFHSVKLGTSFHSVK